MSAFQIFTQPSQQALDTAANVLSGATLTFSLTGTSTPVNAYSEPTLTTPVANPLSANSAGVFIPVFLNPAVVYRIVLKSQAGSVLQTWDPANENIIGYFTQGVIGSILYPQTSAESTAGATPVNAAYPPLCVDRYGTNTTPGVTSMTAAWQAAINVAKAGGGVITYGATAPYLIDAALDCTTAGSPNQFGWIFRGVGGTTDATKIDVIFKHTGHCFDCTGSKRITWDSPCFGTDDTTFPKTLWFFARNSGNGSAGWHKILNPRVRGKFSDSLIYSYASEDNFYLGLDLQNSATGATKLVTITGTNIRSHTSSFVTIATGTRSNIDHQFIGGSFINISGHAASDIFEIEAAEHVKVLFPWMYCASASADGRSLFYINTTNGASSYLKFYGVQGERGLATFLQTYGIYVGDTAATPTGWTIDSCFLPSRTRAIFAHANVILDNFHIRNITEESSAGLSAAGTIQNSSIDSQSMLMTIGTSKQNSLTGDTSRWTITTRDKDAWHESGAANRTWTPNTGALTITGALTVSNVSCLYHGSCLTVTFTMSAATSIVCAAGTNVTGLPAGALVRSADVSVWGGTAGFIGGGAVIGTNLKLPAINVLTEDVTVTATYFVA